MERTQAHTITAKPRHLRLMYFIDESLPLESLRDLIVKNLTLWGGRSNPIIPIRNGMVSAEWLALLNYYDPDFCYISAEADRILVSDLCDQYRLNPVQIHLLDETFSDVHGIHYANLMPLIPKSSFANVYNLKGIETPLYKFFRLNFFVDDTLPVNKDYYSHIENEWLFQGHELLLINKANFGVVNNRLAATSNLTTLSGLNCTEGKLRSSLPEYNGFEIVVAADDQGKEDLLYHWNKDLYEIYVRKVATLYMTRSEFELLITDKDFKGVIKNLSGEDHNVMVTSFSLDDDALSSVVDALNNYSSLNRFVKKRVDCFPYPILDKKQVNPDFFYERESVHVMFQGQPFIFLPELSFKIDYTPTNPLYVCDLTIAQVRSSSNMSLRFPLTFNSDLMLRTASRINKKRQISLMMTPDLHKNGKLNLQLWDFYDIISTTITTPKITGSNEIKNIYRNTGYSDSSNKLAHFLKLFNNDFEFLGDFLSDKFWSDLFYELATSAKSEGDTIIFNDLFDRCYEIMLNQGQVLTTKEEGPWNIENLQLGLKKMLQTLIVRKIFIPGFVIKCVDCSSRIWYSVSEIKEEVICKGCGNINYFLSENPIAYKLNSLVKNNVGTKSAKGAFVPDGNMTAIRTLLYLRNRSLNNFHYIPQIDIYGGEQRHKPITDLDIVSISRGKFYIGECKHSSDLFFESGNKSLLNLIDLAASIKPDVIILACTNDVNGKLAKAVQFLKHHMRSWKYQPEIVPYVTWPPDYFGTNKSSYFYY
ncbi:hypothetical protein LPB86_17070 [Pedobacter sp. MC2016-14]|uniref:hypothetical protein n=1 Tax=Pedobacter sp. MC2016-14 TaxID=2897327 RepID=UPI001E4F878C|nr:hypothetical protein [Pedobacter sp. MC2016-14]MCD0489957.1 hypothetical protein [Pedobacter sp. MC2016-14]